MASSAEAKIGALSKNARKRKELRMVLIEMGHPQPPTPIMINNSTACRIVNKSIKQRCTHAIGMHVYWVRNRCTQKHFTLYWAPCKYNMGDYHTNITQQHIINKYNQCTYMSQNICLTPKSSTVQVDYEARCQNGMTPHGTQQLLMTSAQMMTAAPMTTQVLITLA
eukprot:12966312-Ditylum_brightwellii.AAC.1